MKKLLFATALAMVACAAPAYADIVVTGVSTPDGDGSGSVTTNGYSNYTGPIEFTIRAAAQSRSIAPIQPRPEYPNHLRLCAVDQNGLGQRYRTGLKRDWANRCDWLGCVQGRWELWT